MGVEDTPPRFGSLLNRWKKLDDKVSATTFEKAPPSIKKKKSEHNLQNAKAVLEYKKTFAAKNFKERSPTRGRSIYDKPAQLKNVFGANVEDLSHFEPPVFEKSKEEVKLIAESIKRNFFFDVVRRKELAVLIRAFEPHQVVPNGIIIKQGRAGDYFYVLAEGKVTFAVDGINVGEAEAGSSFGELALLYACPRAATVVAVNGPAKLFRVDQKTFRAVLQNQIKTMEAEKMKLLKSVHFLTGIDHIDLKRLGAAMTPRYYEAGDSVVKKGDQGDGVFIIQEGEFSVTDLSVGTTMLEDTVLKAGDCFGESALVSSEPRKVNVTAVTSGTAFYFDRSTFEKVLGKYSRVVLTVQDRNMLDGVEVLALANLTNKQVAELAHLVSDKTFQAGETIFQELRRHEAALYLLREGTVQLTGKRSDQINTGGYFGEEMLLLDARQDGEAATTKTKPDYSAKAATQCVCGELTLADCRTVFDTTSMVDPNATVEESAEAESDAAEFAAPTVSLNRETTKQWLTKSSKTMLRTAVKSTVTLDDFERHSVLGEGQFGEVWLVSAMLPRKYGKCHFALKKQKKDDPTRGNSIGAIKREIDVLGLMDHPFIVNLVHHYEDPDHLYILMGLVHGGELFDVIHTEQEDGTWHSGIPESDAKFYAMVIADTLDYIHRKQFVFRDLKPENVLIDKDGYPIICDFGFAKFVADKTYTLCGTPNYLSPEVILSQGHNQSSDHWALGVLIYEMVAGENPFYYDGMQQMELFQAIVKEKYYPLPDEISDDAFYVVDELLEKDPSQRLGSLAGRGKDIMAKAWFSELKLGQLRQKKHPAPFIPKNDKLDEFLQEAPPAATARSSLELGSVFAAKNNGEGGAEAISLKLHGTVSTFSTTSLLDDDE